MQESFTIDPHQSMALTQGPLEDIAQSLFEKLKEKEPIRPATQKNLKRKVSEALQTEEHPLQGSRIYFDAEVS